MVTAFIVLFDLVADLVGVVVVGRLGYGDWGSRGESEQSRRSVAQPRLAPSCLNKLTSTQDIMERAEKKKKRIAKKAAKQRSQAKNKRTNGKDRDSTSGRVGELGQASAVSHGWIHEFSPRYPAWSNQYIDSQEGIST